MPDIIQESYNVLNHFLGETNTRGLKRLPEKYDAVLSAVQDLVSYAYKLGIVVGQDEVCTKVYNLTREFDKIPIYPKYVPLTKNKEEK